jgi:ribonuclease HI
LNTNIDIYTDGGCHTISGMGGWAAIIYDSPTPVEKSGYEPDTTNQRMELGAAIEALNYLEQHSRVRLYSDSAYLIDGMNERWYLKWQQNGWKTAKKKPVVNPDLWKELVKLSQFHNVTWMKVKGHAGIPANERCDALVQLEISRGRNPVNR